MTSDGSELAKSPEWVVCECGGNVVIRVWGEGIDSEVWCEHCGNKEIYR